MFPRLRKHVTGLVLRPADELRGWQRSARYGIDLVGHCASRLAEDRAEEMAAALTYRTIFSLIPLFVLGLVVFRIFAGFDAVVQNQIQPRVYEFFGVPDVTYSEPVVVEVEDVASAIEAERERQAKEEMGLPDSEHELRQQRQVQASIQKALTELTSKVANLDFASMGVLGAIFFIYAAMALAVSVEYDFNIICDSPRGRPWHLRVAIYWSIITLGSGLLAASLYLAGEFVSWLAGFGLHPFFEGLLSRVIAFLASTFLLFLLYVLMPNAHVQWRPALIGALAAAMLWETGKALFEIYVRHAVPYSAVYGSLGLLLVFLFWIYTSWLIVLFGLVLGYTIQIMPGRVPPRPEEKSAPSLPGDPDWLIPLLAEVGRCFVQGCAVERQQLSEHLGLPSRIVHEFAGQLEKSGLIHTLRQDTADVSYVLALPPDRIRIADVLELGRTLSRSGNSPHPDQGANAEWKFIDDLFYAKRQAADGATLEDILRNMEQAGQPDCQSTANARYDSTQAPPERKSL